MTDRISPNALHRETAIVLRKLAKGSGYLIHDKGRKVWLIFSARNGYARSTGEAANEVVAALLEQDKLAERAAGGLMAMPAEDDAAHEPRRKLSAITVTAPDGSVADTLRNDTEWALGWLIGRRDATGSPLITQEQLAAAEKLRSDYTLARLERRLTVAWDMPAASGNSRRTDADVFTSLSEKSLAAKQRFFAALDAVGPELSCILLEVCCLSAGLEQAERALGFPRRSGRTILQLALTRLARHYGLLKTEPAAVHRGGIRHWAQAGYRPQMPP